MNGKMVQVPADVVTAISYLWGDVTPPNEVYMDYYNLVAEWLETLFDEPPQFEGAAVLQAYNRAVMAQECYLGYSVAWPKLGGLA